ncbi:hypothetical protein [Citrobacter meridianamericanus]|uniref:hypothetical protein n=1 Tax=Citrobacter meridianamericanus TaxID=2894201 RepID=UPI00351CFB5D
MNNSLDNETLAELIEFRRTTLKHHTDEGNKTQAVLHNMVLVALLELQERRKADSAEPIGWTDAEELRSVEKDGCGYLFKANPISPNADPRRVIKLYRHAQPAPVMNDDLYKLANHVASSKNGLPEEWQDWAEELENEIRRAAMLQGKVDDEVGSWNNHKNTPTAKPVSEPYKVLPTVSFYRDGIEAAANWVDQQRESYDSEHGRQDDETGSFEFGNDAQREYSDTLAEIAEGIRALHPNAGIPPAPEVN